MTPQLTLQLDDSNESARARAVLDSSDIRYQVDYRGGIQLDRPALLVEGIATASYRGEAIVQAVWELRASA